MTGGPRYLTFAQERALKELGEKYQRAAKYLLTRDRCGGTADTIDLIAELAKVEARGILHNEFDQLDGETSTFLRVVSRGDDSHIRTFVFSLLSAGETKYLPFCNEFIEQGVADILPNYSRKRAPEILRNNHFMHTSEQLLQPASESVFYQLTQGGDGSINSYLTPLARRIESFYVSEKQSTNNHFEVMRISIKLAAGKNARAVLDAALK